MCGICGELRFDRQPPRRPFIAAMQARLTARGPDHAGAFFDGPLALGHRRLSVIDLSAASDQPFVDGALRLALVFNGTIYNFRELRAELIVQGYTFSSDGDTEVIGKAYRAWGRDCVKHLDGMFAFALWDQDRHELFCARDRFGIKPFYYALDGRRFAFASTLPALMADPALPRDLDPVGLQFQFTLHGSVPAPWTVMKAIRKLPPAHTLLMDENGTPRIERYWTLAASRPTPQPDEAAELAETEATLTHAVQSHLEAASVPVGVLLSGGLDSSLLVALMDKLGHQQIDTFSIGFAAQPEESGDEFQYSDLVARHFKTRHHQFEMSDAAMLEALPQAIAAMSEPMFSQDNVAFWLLAREVKKSVKAVLSGQGADEVFGGYYWYPQMAASSPSLPALERFAPFYFDRSHAELAAMFAPGFIGEDAVSPFIAGRLAEPGAQTFMDAVLRLDATTLIVDDPVKRVDNMTMAHGLEARVPFLDKSLVEAAMRQPPDFRLREKGKYPLKTLARRLLPAAIIDRPKGYFPTPALKYLRGGFLEFIRATLNAPACRERGLYDRAHVDRLLAEPLHHFTPLQGNKLWHLAALEAWLQMTA